MPLVAPCDVLASAELGGFARPLAWARPCGLGRVCYSALGHGLELLDHQSVQLILRNALDWLRPTGAVERG